MFLLPPLLTISLGLTSVFSKSTRNCRCTSGSECWLSDSEFQTLASKVSQPPIYPVPPATPCYDPAAGNSPESGAYFNEASRYEFDWKKPFFSAHYDKLLTIKRKYDLTSLFLAYEGVGSDEWDGDLVCNV